MSLEGLDFLREHAVELHIPLLPGKKAPETITVRVPSLSAFLVHKGAVFFRRRDRARKAKDILYIVEIMAEGDPLVTTVEEGILSLCQESPESASVPRTARNHLALLLAQPPDAILHEVTEAFAARHGTSPGAATARTRGLLEDFLHAIPEDCGGGER